MLMQLLYNLQIKIYAINTVQYKILVGENFGEFCKTNAIHQYFTQPNSRFTKVANVSYCKFANIFLDKTHKTIDSPKFYPTKITLSAKLLAKAITITSSVCFIWKCYIITLQYTSWLMQCNLDAFKKRGLTTIIAPPTD